jgi:hypothetical protein
MRSVQDREEDAEGRIGGYGVEDEVMARRQIIRE